MMEVWIGRDSERHGPYKEAEVREWLRSGQLSPADLGWYEGLADWQPLSVLFPLDKPAAAPASAPAFEPFTPPLPQQPAATTYDYAGFWQRFGAWVIDLVVLLVPWTIAFYAFGGMDAYKHFLEQAQSGADMATALSQYAMNSRGASVATVLIGFIYYTVFEASKWQATPGKLALRLRVTDMQGHGLNMGRSAARNAVRLLNLILWVIPMVCYLAAAWTQRKQGLHDLVASTLVLNGRASEPTVAQTSQGRDDGTFNA